MKGGAETRMWTSLAPASRSRLMIWRQVVPRTMESSTITTRLPATSLRRADSLGYLSLEGLHQLAPDARCGFCEGCFTEQYPIPVE